MSDIKIPTMLSLKDTAERTGLSFCEVRLLCIENKVPHIRLGSGNSGKILVNLEKLIEYLNTAGGVNG